MVRTAVTVSGGAGGRRGIELHYVRRATGLASLDSRLAVAAARHPVPRGALSLVGCGHGNRIRQFRGPGNVANGIISHLCSLKLQVTTAQSRRPGQGQWSGPRPYRRAPNQHRF